jgi:hypothetical protein
MSQFKKSSKCSGGSCVRVGIDVVPGLVFVLDEFGNRTTFDHQEWKDFIEAVKEGEFDIE